MKQFIYDLKWAFVNGAMRYGAWYGLTTGYEGVQNVVGFAMFFCAFTSTAFLSKKFCLDFASNLKTKRVPQSIDAFYDAFLIGICAYYGAWWWTMACTWVFITTTYSYGVMKESKNEPTSTRN